MSPLVLSQLKTIRSSGICNMCDYKAVQYYAQCAGMEELVHYIEEDPSRYFHFILYGEEPHRESVSRVGTARGKLKSPGNLDMDNEEIRNSFEEKE